MKKYTLLFAIMLGLNTMILSQIPSYTPSNGLIGWWPFSGNANDLSGNGNNGTLNGPTISTDRFGQSNNAYSFDGLNDFISLPNILPVQIGTISFWFQTNSNNAQILVYHANSNGDDGFGSANANTIEDHTGLTSSPTNVLGACYVFDNSSGISHTSTETIAQNQWYHMAVTFNSTTAFCYINGLLIYTMNISSESGNNSPTVTYIGRPRLATRFLSGKFDDLGVWNRVLTQQEITNLYNGCNLNFSVNNQSSSIGQNVNFNATQFSNTNYQWQTNPANNGWQNVNSNSSYSGATTNNLVINNVQLSNHNQPFRVITSAGTCIDTSNIASLQINDTCITNVTLYDTTYVTVTDTNVITVYDTLLTTVTDTLIINTTLGLPAPNNENTILIYPNPASDFITIDNGNYIAMAGYSIKIENNAGQQVFQSNINQQLFTIDLSTWSGDGLYFVHLIDVQGNTVTVRKIVLQ
jgi:hypothetical protein